MKRFLLAICCWMLAASTLSTQPQTSSAAYPGEDSTDDYYDYDEEYVWDTEMEEDEDLNSLLEWEEDMPATPEPSTGDYVKFILFALLPAVLLLIFILWRDRLRPEPVKEILIAIGLGILTIPMAIFLETWLCEEGWFPSTFENMGIALRTAFIGAAIPEELCKIAVLSVFFLWRRKQDEYMDGIVYAVCIGLAFAAIENVKYILEAADSPGYSYYGASIVWSTGVLRGLLSIPGHFGFAVMMGFFYSLFLFSKERRGLWLALAFVVPVLFHGLYDGFIFMQEVNSVWTGLLVFLFYAIFFLMSNLCVKAIRATLKRDDAMFTAREERP